jgi:hypothetical protein
MHIAHAYGVYGPCPTFQRYRVIQRPDRRQRLLRLHFRGGLFLPFVKPRGKPRPTPNTKSFDRGPACSPHY